MNRKIAISIAIAVFLLANDAGAGSRLLRGRGAMGWQVFIVHTNSGTEFALSRGGQRLKYATDVNAPEIRLTSLEALEARLQGLKPRQFVHVDQWNQGASVDELTLIKNRIGDICVRRNLRCVYAF